MTLFSLSLLGIYVENRSGEIVWTGMYYLPLTDGTFVLVSPWFVLAILDFSPCLSSECTKNTTRPHFI
jgi:hypothetical protein